jgi:putative toxin-antitoxin system antitoxin component (TIGR02293 family)
MATVTEVLGGEKHLGHKIRKGIDLDGVIREGLPLDTIDRIRKIVLLTEGEILKTIGISSRTLSRRKKEKKAGKLSIIESDRLYRLAKIYTLAEHVFNDRDQAVEWLHGKQFGLGGRIPLDMLQTEVGMQEVEDLLMRIEYGVYS